MRIAIASLFVTTIALANAACTSAPPAARHDQPLLAKQAALVTIQFYDGDRAQGSCAGVLVGPQAVLTAGHCVSNKSRAVIVAPNAGGKKAESHRAWWFDWTDNASPKTSPQLHDVAILSLDTPIELKKYPKIAEEPIASGTKTLHVRRVKGHGSKSKISFEATPGVARSQKDARSHYYKIDNTVGSLDSGGPVFDSRSGKIVGVVSTKGKSHALYVTKTKSLTKWLRQQLLSLLETPPKPPAPASAADAGAPKPPTTSSPAPSSGTPAKPPASSGAAPKPSSGSGMGRQSGAGTKASNKPSKPASSKPSGTKPTEKEDAGTDCPEGETDCDTTCKDGNCDCESGDLECQPGCDDQGGAGGGECETPCEGGDESCEDPQCEESESCECDGEECGGEEDPFEDPEYGQEEENENVDEASEDVANDESETAGEEQGDQYGSSDDYSESGYEDNGSEEYASDDSADYSDYGGEDYGGGEE